MEIKPVHPKGNQSWIFIGKTDAEAETPILWPPDAKNWLIRQDPDAGKDRRWEEKGMTEDEMFGWHHWLNGCEFEQPLGVDDGEGSLTCCSPWGRKELDMTEWQNWTEKQYSCSLRISWINYDILIQSDQDNHDGMITHLEPEILECEVKWALESITTNKASGNHGIPVELFQILNDDAVKVLH